MFAELFYPKELKEVITELRAKYDLNKKAVEEINNSIRLPVIFSLIIFLILLYKNSFHFSFLVGLMIFFLLRVAFQGRVISFSLAYTLGQPIVGRIEDVHFSRYNPGTPDGWNIRYVFEAPLGHVNKKRQYVLPEDMPKETFKKGDEIQVYVYKKNKQALFLTRYFEKHCLSASHIHKTLQYRERND